jgi:hypothetical protein
MTAELAGMSAVKQDQHPHEALQRRCQPPMQVNCLLVLSAEVCSGLQRTNQLLSSCWLLAALLHPVLLNPAVHPKAVIQATASAYVHGCSCGMIQPWADVAVVDTSLIAWDTVPSGHALEVGVSSGSDCFNWTRCCCVPLLDAE